MNMNHYFLLMYYFFVYIITIENSGFYKNIDPFITFMQKVEYVRDGLRLKHHHLREDIQLRFSSLSKRQFSSRIMLQQSVACRKILWVMLRQRFLYRQTRSWQFHLFAYLE